MHGNVISQGHIAAHGNALGGQSECGLMLECALVRLVYVLVCMEQGSDCENRFEEGKHDACLGYGKLTGKCLHVSAEPVVLRR